MEYDRDLDDTPSKAARLDREKWAVRRYSRSRVKRKGEELKEREYTTAMNARR